MTAPERPHSPPRAPLPSRRAARWRPGAARTAALLAALALALPPGAAPAADPPAPATARPGAPGPFASVTDVHGRDLPVSDPPGVRGNRGRGFRSTSAGTALRGGEPGTDATFFVVSDRDTVEVLAPAAPGRAHTLVAYGRGYTLPDGVANLVVPNADALGGGNGAANLIAGGEGPQTLDGGPGDDVLTGGPGPDTFVVRAGEGSDAIADFEPGVDRLALRGFGPALARFDAVRRRLSASGPDTVLALPGGGRVVLRGRSPGDLSREDFRLPLDRAGLTRTFAEEFDGEFRWSPQGGGGRWKTTYQHDLRTLPTNKEWEYYSDASVGRHPFSVADGVLTIRAEPVGPGGPPVPEGLRWTSGAITTERWFGQRHGVFEIRARLPSGRGFWPAFWLLPTDLSWPPELDVLELLGHESDTFYASVVSRGTDRRRVTTANRVRAGRDLTRGFHEWAADWGPETIRWYLDGEEVASAPTPPDMTKPMHILVNLAVGGPGSWPGRPERDDSTAEMAVDWVRAWRRAEVPAR